jgi:hypothetical protein
MSPASNRAERCRHLAEECRQLATISSSTDIRDRYLRMAERYSKLAEAENLSTTGSRETRLATTGPTTGDELGAAASASSTYRGRP